MVQAQPPSLHIQGAHNLGAHRALGGGGVKVQTPGPPCSTPWLSRERPRAARWAGAQGPPWVVGDGGPPHPRQGELLKGPGDWGQCRKTDQSPIPVAIPELGRSRGCSDCSPPGLAPCPWARAPALPCLGPTTPRWLPPSFVPGRLPRPCGWAHGQSWSRRHNKPAQARPAARGWGRAAGAGRRAAGGNGGICACKKGSRLQQPDRRHQDLCVLPQTHTHTHEYTDIPPHTKTPRISPGATTEAKETGPASTICVFTVYMHGL